MQKTARVPKPFPDALRHAMAKAAEQNLRPYTPRDLELLDCQQCWVTPIGLHGRATDDPHLVTGQYVVTHCRAHYPR